MPTSSHQVVVRGTRRRQYKANTCRNGCLRVAPEFVLSRMACTPCRPILAEMKPRQRKDTASSQAGPTENLSTVSKRYITVERDAHNVAGRTYHQRSPDIPDYSSTPQSRRPSSRAPATSSLTTTTRAILAPSSRRRGRRGRRRRRLGATSTLACPR